MTEFGERLIKSAKQALEIAQGKAKPGTYRVTQYDDDGNATVLADFSEEFLAQIDAEREEDDRAKTPSIEQPTG